MNASTSLTKYDRLPIVAVVGKPNVGKSTLFNRLVKKRKAITDPRPGVTRDPVEALWEFEDKKALLIDTGGFRLSSETLDKQINDKAINALDKADLILFLVEVIDITGEDEDFAEVLRRYQDKIVLVVNKVDNEKREQDVWNFCQLGFNDVIGISAEHGYNYQELCELIVSKINFSLFSQDYEQERALTIALLGKPNTGKSTLTNKLLDQSVSIVSDIPGTTRDVIEGVFNYRKSKIKVLDTAGLRKKKKVGENIEYYSTIRAIDSISEADVVILLIDAQENLSTQDKKIAGQIINRGKGLVMALNKWDLLKKMPNQLEAFIDRIRFLFPVLSYAPILPISAKDGEGLDKLLNMTIEVNRELHKRIDTGVLNRAFGQWLRENPPPSGKGKPKLKYISHVQTAPLVFLIFVNKKEYVPDSYLTYIGNKIRQEFGFKHVPLRIELREQS